jgi:hypothetical protein
MALALGTILLYGAKQTWSIGVRITLALLLVAGMRNATKLYMVQEILLVLFVVAVSTVTIFAIAEEGWAI